MDKKVVELFAGVGGFRCGLNDVLLVNNETVEQGDWDFVWANQWEPATKTQDAFNCYVKRFGNSAQHSNTDIGQVDKTTIPDHSLLCGGFPCLTADTLVLTNNGYKKIVDVQENDAVLSHDGRYHKVSSLLVQGTKPTYKISSFAFDSLHITGNHLLYVRKLEDGSLGVPEWKSVEELLVLDTDGNPLYKKYLLSNMINGNSRIPKIKGLDLGDFSFWYALGQFIGNGFDENELFLFPKTYQKETIKEFLTKFKVNDNLSLPGLVFDTATNMLKYFLDGYVNSATGYQEDGFTYISTESKELIYGLAQCVGKVYRVPCYIKKMNSISGNSSKYILSFKEKLSEYDNCYYLNRNIWYPFEKIEETGLIEEVFDLIVEDSHSFTANGCTVHNCQDYSVARSLSNEKGIEGKKGVLWWQIAEILETKQPPFVLLENVDRLLISPAKQRGRDFAIMLRTFYDLGYSVQWQVINAADYGMPQKRRRIFIFAYKMETKYYASMKDFLLEDIILKKGLFGKNFPVEKCEDFYHLDIFSYKDVLDVSNNHKTGFLNSGCMMNGVVYSVKTKAIPENIYPLKDILVQQPVAQNHFLDEKEIEKFKYLKGTKRIPRVKPNGEPYIYSEGQMPFPDNLEVPARTMLTSESSVNRSTHVVKDVESGELRYLTPVEAERINCFPDDWTNTGMTEKRRYFMMGNALVVGIIKRLSSTLNDIVIGE